MSETERTDQGQSGGEQQSSVPVEGVEIQKGANVPPRPGPVSEVPDQQPPPNPNVPVQKSADLTDVEPGSGSSQSRETSGSSTESSGE